MNKIIMPGTRIKWHGRPGVIGAVGFIGERYYWVILDDTSVIMAPAIDIEDNLKILGQAPLKPGVKK